eukprot:3125955-Rhodomonas_salina.2
MGERLDVETHNPLHDSHMYGVGIKFKVEGDRAKIMHLQAGCSAALSNALQRGDVIISVNGKDVRGEYCEQLARRSLNGRSRSLLPGLLLCLVLTILQQTRHQPGAPSQRDPQCIWRINHAGHHGLSSPWRSKLHCAFAPPR